MQQADAVEGLDLDDGAGRVDAIGNVCADRELDASASGVVEEVLAPSQVA